jgi:hypothetical protein
MGSVSRGLFVLVGVAAAVGAGPVSALDIAIPAKVAAVKSGKIAKFVAKNAAGFALPAPGGIDDPTVAGAQLSFFDTEMFAGGSASFALGAAGWKGLGNPAGSKGYKYKGAADGGGPCSVVLLKEKVIKAVCKGSAVTLTPPFGATLGINLGIPAGTVVARRYCAELGGTEAKNDEKGLKRTDAAAPAACAALPSGFRSSDLDTLADDSMAGRNNNTPGSTLAQNFLIAQLKEMGAAGLNSSQTGDEQYKQHYVQSGKTGTNILGILPGSTLPNEYIFVGAHYDHLGSGCAILEVGDTVCNGATDNAAGVTAALGVARGIAALPVKPRRSVVIAFWDTEEDGLLGSLYYSNNPIVPLANTKGYINFDIQGANLLPSLRDFTFAVGAESGSTLGGIAAQAANAAGLSGERQLSWIFGQGRSDYVNFTAKNVPTIFYSDSTGPCYHTNQDEPAVVDFGKLQKQTRRAYDVAIELANTNTPPTFATVGSPLAVYGDAVVLDEVLTAGLADIGLFAPADQTLLSNAQAQIHAMVVDGPANFDNADVSTLLANVINVVDVLTRTACDGFLAP